MRRDGADGVLCPDLQIGVLGAVGLLAAGACTAGAGWGVLKCSLWPRGVHHIHQGFKELIVVCDLLFVFNHIEDFIEGELIGNGLKTGVFIEHLLDEFFGDLK